MSVPELTTRTTDPRAFARILRAALRCQTVGVPLDRPPAATGAHLLHVLFEGSAEKAVWVLAEPAGMPEAGLCPLRLQPRSRTQAAQLFALAQIVGGGSVFPPDEAPPSVRVYSQPPPASTTEPGAMSLTGTMPLVRRVGPAPPLPADLADPIAGRLIAGKYRVDELVGAGATGVVYRGVHVDLDRPVAIKILHEETRANPTAVRRFEAEARGAARLDHPNIVRVLDAGQEPDRLLYLVMELVEGQTLETLLASIGKLPAARAVDIAFQVAGALARAHAEGIVHRDVKPENVMLTRGLDIDSNTAEIVKVCDFGVAKALGSEGGLTVAGALVGSPVYMSPEQARGAAPEPRSDVYSLGVVLFEITTGRLPFTGDDVGELVTKHVAEPPPRPSSIDPSYDPRLEAIVLRTLAKDPSRRPNARDLRTELRALAAHPSQSQ